MHPPMAGARTKRRVRRSIMVSDETRTRLRRLKVAESESDDEVLRTLLDQLVGKPIAEVERP